MKYFLFLALPLSACGQHQDPCIAHKPNHLMEYICEDADGFSDAKPNTVLPDHPPVVDNGEGSGDTSDDDWDTVSDDSNGDNSDDHDKGHGNDEDGHDEDNPGKGKGKKHG